MNLQKLVHSQGTYSTRTQQIFTSVDKSQLQGCKFPTSQLCLCRVVKQPLCPSKGTHTAQGPDRPWRLQHSTERLSSNSGHSKPYMLPYSSNCSFLKFFPLWLHMNFYFRSTATAPTASTVHWRKWIRMLVLRLTPVRTVCYKTSLISFLRTAHIKNSGETKEYL